MHELQPTLQTGVLHVLSGSGRGSPGKALKVDAILARVPRRSSAVVACNKPAPTQSSAYIARDEKQSTPC